MKYTLIIIGCVFALSVRGAVPDSLLRTTTNARNKISFITLKNQLNQGFNYWDAPFRGHWAGIFVGWNGLARKDYSTYPSSEQNFMNSKLSRSNILDLNFLQLAKGIQRNRNTIGLITGLGLRLQSYTLAKTTSITKADDHIEPLPLNYDSDQKSKFSSTYLLLPLLIEFQVPTRHYGNSLYLSTGITAGMRLRSHTKVKYLEDNKKQKLKTPGDFYLRTIRYAATVRLGYRRINLFATYDLQTLFKTSKGPELHDFSFGFALFTF